MSTEFVIDLDKVFTDYVNAQQKSWSHDRSLTLGASEVFSCLRMNFFKKRGKEFGYEPDDDFEERWGAMQRGNLIEDHHVAPAMAHLPEPLKALYVGQANQQTLVKGRNSATPDGLITGVPKGSEVVLKTRSGITRFTVNTGCFGLEIKSIDPRARLEEERAKHHGQSQVGLGLIRELTEWQPEHWLILYVDASFLDNMKTFLVEWDPDIYQAAKMRAPRVWATDDPFDLPAEGKYAGDCDHCAFRRACGEGTLSRYKELQASEKAKKDIGADAFIAGEMAPDVAEFLHLKEVEADTAFRLGQLKEKLVAGLTASGQRKVAGENWRVTWSAQKGRKTLDKNAMIADGIDVSRYEKEGSPFDVLRVARKEDDLNGEE